MCISPLLMCRVRNSASLPRSKEGRHYVGSLVPFHPSHTQNTSVHTPLTYTHAQASAYGTNPAAAAYGGGAYGNPAVSAPAYNASAQKYAYSQPPVSAPPLPDTSAAQMASASAGVRVCFGCADNQPLCMTSLLRTHYCVHAAVYKSRSISSTEK